MEKLPDNLAAALDARAKGIAAIPCHPGTKVPMVRWKPYQAELPSPETLRAWFADVRTNVAVVCTGLVIFDVDQGHHAAHHADLVARVLRECGDTPHKIKTPHGLHLGYRARSGVALQNKIDVKGMDIDIKTSGGLEMIPPSRTEEGEYTWLGSGLRRVADLPVAKIGWTRERTRRLMKPLPVDDSVSAVRRARAYIARIEGAISGQRGHDRTMRVAGVLIQKFGLTIEQAWPLLLEWNGQCEPPWSERELLHKLQDAEKNRGKYPHSLV